MDQAGAVAGPLIVTAVLHFGDGYCSAFAVLLVPALLAMAVLVASRFLYPRPQDLELTAPHLETKGFTRKFWLYLAAVALGGRSPTGAVPAERCPRGCFWW